MPYTSAAFAPCGVPSCFCATGAMLEKKILLQPLNLVDIQPAGPQARDRPWRADA